MAIKSNLVNLDAMIRREDFAANNDDKSTFETINNISVRDLVSGGFMMPILRKPDFQRETNHWTPEQVVSLLECYVNGDLIPSVILWRSPTYLFVIDGGHRLSVLKAWVEDDYGDGALSHKLFGHQISTEQKQSAEKTRKLIKEKIGPWTYYKSLLDNSDNLTVEQRTRVSTITTRGFQVQWVQGDANKAETSFFNINMKGTPLDDLEELLLRNRHKPIPIAARAIIRAGRGHRYWSSFEIAVAERIETEAENLHRVLFSPELARPVKTLDLPLGGSKGVRTAIQVLIEFVLIATRTQQKAAREITDFEDDLTGDGTLDVLRRAAKLANRITGNSDGSLGLHPAIYFYGPTGRHSSPMFLGTVSLIAEKLVNNDVNFLKKFTKVRKALEDLLIRNKDLIATILQRHISGTRVARYHELLGGIVSLLNDGADIGEEQIINLSKLEGKVLSSQFKPSQTKISEDQKSKIFIHTALKQAVNCPICYGYLDMEKSVSYDHIIRVRDGGMGNYENVQLTHPYCNQSIKN